MTTLQKCQSTLRRSSLMALGVQGLYDISSTQKLDLGTRVDLADGRSFVYGQAGALALAAGLLTQSPIPSANWDNQATTVDQVVGDTQVSVTFGGAVTANFFAGGWLFVNDATGEGNMYPIRSHAAGTTGVVIYLNEELRTVITAGATEVTLYPHHLSNLIVAPTTLTAAIQGVPLVEITAGYFGWIQVKGPACVLVAATLNLALPCECATTAGGVIPSAETTYGPIVGVPLILAAATEYALINLSIPGY